MAMLMMPMVIAAIKPKVTQKQKTTPSQRSVVFFNQLKRSGMLFKYLYFAKLYGTLRVKHESLIILHHPFG